MQKENMKKISAHAGIVRDAAYIVRCCRTIAMSALPVQGRGQRATDIYQRKHMNTLDKI